MATAAESFQQTWRIGRNVEEKASPHRRGAIRSRSGSGNNAQIVVNLSGRPPVTFHPPQLTPL